MSPNDSEPHALGICQLLNCNFFGSYEAQILSRFLKIALTAIIIKIHFKSTRLHVTYPIS